MKIMWVFLLSIESKELFGDPYIMCISIPSYRCKNLFEIIILLRILSTENFRRDILVEH
jgi:hypothetical protein